MYSLTHGRCWIFQFAAKERMLLCSICPVSSTLMTVDGEGWKKKRQFRRNHLKRKVQKGSQVLPSGKQMRARQAFQFRRCAELIKAGGRQWLKMWVNGSFSTWSPRIPRSRLRVVVIGSYFVLFLIKEVDGIFCYSLK